MRKHFAYYNEFDPNAAAWLRELITLGAIMDGEVDERSITDVRADDLDGFTRCHFFAGIGGWDLALRRAGVPATRPLWTASLPCQPFSCAGKQAGMTDSRHLWPVFFELVKRGTPPAIYGEQVSAAIKMGWLDGVFDDLEAVGYECAATVLTAAVVGAPHIRSRIYWTAAVDTRRVLCYNATKNVVAANRSNPWRNFPLGKSLRTNGDMHVASASV